MRVPPRRTDPEAARISGLTPSPAPVSASSLPSGEVPDVPEVAAVPAVADAELVALAVGFGVLVASAGRMRIVRRGVLSSGVGSSLDGN
jgi:hypothetical protein